MHSKPDQTDLLLCLMYPPFEVFFFAPEKTECKTKVYTFLLGLEQVQLHNVSIYLVKEREGKSLCCSTVSERLLLWCWRRVKGGDWRVCAVSIWGWWHRGDGQLRPQQSITSWQWLSLTTSAVVAMANSESVTGCVFRSCQSNTRSPTMTSVVPALFETAVRIKHTLLGCSIHTFAAATFNFYFF